MVSNSTDKSLYSYTPPKNDCTPHSGCTSLNDNCARVEGLERWNNSIIVELSKWTRICSEQGAEINDLKRELKELKDNIHQMTGTRRLLVTEERKKKWKSL